MPFSIRVISLSITLIVSPGLGAGAARACDLDPDWKDHSDWSAPRGIFFKPDARSCPPNVLELMPLIVIDQTEAAAGSAAALDTGEVETRIVTVDERVGELAIVGGAPAIYVTSKTIDAGGAVLRQWTFVWWVASPEKGSSDGDSLAMAAIRMTLDVEGRPIVWEAVDQTHWTVGVFASESFVKTIRLDRSDPPDWRPADILNSNGQSHAALARVLTDAPATMGPMVYCDRRGGIVTVACRCMPSQVEQVARNVDYRVVRINDLAEIEHLLSLSGDARFQKLFADWRRATWLSDSLRWPRED